MRTKRHAFTLLEILLALAILGFAASVVGWQIAKSVRIYRFQHEVEDLYLAIKHAQILALTHQTDICLRVHKSREEFVYYLETDEPFPEGMFDNKQHTLQAIKKITTGDKTTEHLDLSLFSQGNIEPRGMLGLFSQDGSSQWLDFQGAFLLKLSHQKPEPLKEQSPALPILKK